jgi:bifunctional enzyme CysN/CysC
VWITGLPGSGKTTLAEAVRRRLSGDGRPSCILDGDELRSGLSSDLGLTREDRAEQARRAAHVARLISRAGIVAIVALVSPYAEDRTLARETHTGLEFLEVWVDTPLAVCEQRDPKGLFRRARAGELGGLTGVDSPYELPSAPDVTVRGYGVEPTVAADVVIAAFDAQRSRLQS